MRLEALCSMMNPRSSEQSLDRMQSLEKGTTMFQGFTDSDAQVHNLRLQEQRTYAERHNRLTRDDSVKVQRPSLVSRLAVLLTRPVRTLTPQH